MGKTTVIIGNNRYDNDCLELVEYEDGETEQLSKGLLERTYENTLLGYSFVCPGNTAGCTVYLNYYYRRPVTDVYWNQVYGAENSSFYPLLFTFNNESKHIGTILNSTVDEITVSAKSNGWIRTEINLKRELQKDEYLFFGVFSKLFSPTSSSEYIPDNSVESIDCMIDYSYTYQKVLVDYLQSNDFVSAANNSSSACDICHSIYLEMVCDIPCNHNHIISDNFMFGEVMNEEIGFNRIPEEQIIHTNENLFRKAFYSKMQMDIFCTQENNEIKRCITRKSSNDLYVSCFVEKKSIFRSLFSEGINYSASSVRKLNMKIMEYSGVLHSSLENRQLNVARIMNQRFDLISKSKRFLLINRIIQLRKDIWDYEENVIRQADNTVVLYCPLF